MPETAPFVQILGEPAIATPSARYGFEQDLRYHLLAYLAYHGSWISRERLARLFWPEADPRPARHNLRQLLKRTRRLPWRPAIEATGRHHDLRLRWRPPTDLAALDAAMAAGDVPGAVRLYGGGLLEGVRAEGAPAFAAWLEVERGQVRDRFGTWLSDRARALADAGRHDEAAASLARVLDLDALDEDALRAYMGAAARAGQRQRALARYERFAAHLEAEMSLPPTAATVDLARRIRDGRIDAAVVGSTARHVAEAAAGLPDRVAPPGHERGTTLVGRRAEIEVLRRRLADPTCRLLTITGPGGVGKSRLGRYAAEGLATRFADGVVQVDLHGPSSADSLPNAVAAALSLAVGLEVDPLGRLAQAIGERQMLVVLDDLDALPGCAATIASLLSRCRHLVVLATARERLRLVDEWLLPLEGLAFAGAGTPLAEAAATDAVRLFLLRAERLRPDHDLLGSELRHVVEICRLVGGLPLGIELAAAWVRTLTCAEIAAEIAADLAFLTRDAPDAAERHGSVRAAFDHSWRNLTDDERRSLERLSVFRGRFDRMAVSHVAGCPLAILAALVDKSLLRATG
jgi:predicted ATPase/DNA-binding SARP family transcriptional activator